MLSGARKGEVETYPYYNADTHSTTACASAQGDVFYNAPHPSLRDTFPPKGEGLPACFINHVNPFRHFVPLSPKGTARWECFGAQKGEGKKGFPTRGSLSSQEKFLYAIRFVDDMESPTKDLTGTF